MNRGTIGQGKEEIRKWVAYPGWTLLYPPEPLFSRMLSFMLVFLEKGGKGSCVVGELWER